MPGSGSEGSGSRNGSSGCRGGGAVVRNRVAVIMASRQSGVGPQRGGAGRGSVPGGPIVTPAARRRHLNFPRRAPALTKGEHLAVEADEPVGLRGPQVLLADQAGRG